MSAVIPNEENTIRSNCRGCHGGCGVLVTVKNGVIDRIEGDPEFPTNYGTLCSKGLAFKQLVYHPDRLKYPLKRVGKRGEGKWERITWDEALETIANKVCDYKARFGAESIVLAQGTSREYESFLSRFANLLGTPNVMGAGYMCYLSRVVTALTVCGKLPIVDYEGDPQCVVVWGSNVVWNNPDEYTGENLMRVLSQGSKLIVVDPRLTYLAGRADVWLQLRPGTDTALMLGIANVIIQEGLYDKEFVARYVHGWEEFCQRAGEYPLDRVAQITWTMGIGQRHGGCAGGACTRAGGDGGAARRCCAISEPVPSGSRRPSDISRIRSACSITNGSCVAAITVTPCAATPRSSAKICAPVVLSSSPVGSSAMIRRGWFASARATATRCCSPPDSS